MTIKQQRAQIRADLFSWSMKVLENLGASKDQQAGLMVKMLAKAYEIESKLSDEQVLEAIKNGPGDELLKEFNIA